MKLKFKLLNKHEIGIIAVKDRKEKQIGKIFTPSGSGSYIKNAIQICGFTEAFDLWGCGLYGRTEGKENVVARLEGKKKPIIQTKDIQLLFDWDIIPHRTENEDMVKDCWRCYNKPCTCEIKDKNKSPYTVKREKDLKIEIKIRK